MNIEPQRIPFQDISNVIDAKVAFLLITMQMLDDAVLAPYSLELPLPFLLSLDAVAYNCHTV